MKILHDKLKQHKASPKPKTTVIVYLVTVEELKNIGAMPKAQCMGKKILLDLWGNNQV